MCFYVFPEKSIISRVPFQLYRKLNDLKFQNSLKFLKVAYRAPLSRPLPRLFDLVGPPTFEAWLLPCILEMSSCVHSTHYGYKNIFNNKLLIGINNVLTIDCSWWRTGRSTPTKSCISQAPGRTGLWSVWMISTANTTFHLLERATAWQAVGTVSVGCGLTSTITLIHTSSATTNGEHKKKQWTNNDYYL